jgi:hypothetical protein
MAVTSCDPINPYTETGTFGVSYNGGFKPDPTIEWIPPDTNTVDIDRDDDFVTPNFMPPANIYVSTLEGRRFDYRQPVKAAEIQYDERFTLTPEELEQTEMKKKHKGLMHELVEEIEPIKFLALITFIVFLIWLITRR